MIKESKTTQPQTTNPPPTHPLAPSQEGESKKGKARERKQEGENQQPTTNNKVVVQDCFFPHPDFPESPISEPMWQEWWQIWGEAMVEEIPRGESWEVGLRLSGDREIQSLNARYRQKDVPTDVLAFAALEVDFPQAELEGEPIYLGDIVISVETAARQAIQQGHSLKIELAWLASHGFLHLLGWDHPDEENLRKMLDRQRILLKMTGLFKSDR